MMNRRGRLQGTALVLCLAGAACGGSDGAGAPIDAVATVDTAGVPDAQPAACSQSGYACTWLGVPGLEAFNGDGFHRLATETYWPFDMVFMPDGTPWFIDWNNHLVRRVKADDTVETIVGVTDPIFPGDGTGDFSVERSAPGALGTLVQLNHPTDLRLSPDGSIVLMAWHNHKVRRIDPVTGFVRIIGGGGAGFAGDGAAVGAGSLFKQPSGLEVDAVGNIYVVDQQNFRVRRIDANSNEITTIAGVGTAGFSGDDGPALEAQFRWAAGSNPEPSGGLALADGVLYVADSLNNRIRAINLETTVVTTIAGDGTEGYGGDGGAALAAQLRNPRDLEIGPEGDLYIADTDNSAVRAVSLTTGMIRTVVGTGVHGLGAEGLLATETQLRRPFGIQFDNDGNLFVADTVNSRILKVIR